jgi:hypothetical protein
MMHPRKKPVIFALTSTPLPKISYDRNRKMACQGKIGRLVGLGQLRQNDQQHRSKQSLVIVR